MSERRGSSYKDGARQVLALTPAIGALGVVLGYQSADAGLSPVAAMTMSATTFAGSPQFASIGVFGAGGSILVAVASAAALATRFAAMSAIASPAITGRKWTTFFLAQFVVDETWAVAYRPGRGFDRKLLIGAGATLYIVHVVSTVIGAVFGNMIGAMETWGLDAISPALFVILLAPSLRFRNTWVPTLAAIGSTAVAIHFAPLGIPLLIAITVVVALAAFGQKRRQGAQH